MNGRRWVLAWLSCVTLVVAARVSASPELALEAAAKPLARRADPGGRG